MAPEDDLDLPNTQSQSLPEDIVFSQGTDEIGDVWGRLVAKHKSFHNVGTYFLYVSLYRKSLSI